MLALAAAAAIEVGSAAQAQDRIFWPKAYPDAYIPYPYPDDIDAPPPVARRQPHRKRHHLAKPAAAKTIRKPKGPIIIAISIDRQTMKVYDANGFFAETPVSTGMRGHSTPLGVFSVIQKQKWHRSNIYSGAPMPYMQRITWSGIAMHAGVLPGYPASHGCIRMPMSFAVKLWGWTRTGARVIITPGEVTPVEFSHPMLVTHRPEPVETAAAPASTVGEVRTADASGTTPQATASDISAEHRDNSDAMASASAAELRSGIGPDDAASRPTPKSAAASDDAKVTATDAEMALPAPKRSGRIAVFVSRKDSKIYVRQNFAPLFDAPIAISASDRPLGTHVFTAEADNDDNDNFHWSVVSLPALTHRAMRVTRDNRIHHRNATVHAAPRPAQVQGSPADALNRIAVPEDVMTKIAESLTSGDSIVVSDQGIADGETGEGTDFIVTLR